MDAMVQPKLDRYLRIIGQYDSEFAKWAARTKKIIKRYRDDTRGQTLTESAKFNNSNSNTKCYVNGNTNSNGNTYKYRNTN